MVINIRVIKVWDQYHGFHKNIVLFSTLIIIRNAMLLELQISILE